MTFGQQWTGNGFEKARALSVQVLKSFDYIAARDSASRQRLQDLGVAADLGYDPAFLLPFPAAARQPSRVTLFIRGGPYGEHYLRLARPVLEWLRKQRAEIFLGACAPVDENVFPILQRIIPGAQTRGTSFDWPRGLDLVKSSSLVLSLGRLHAAVLATHVGTPTVAAGLPCHHPPERIEGFSIDAGLPFVPFEGEGLVEKVKNSWDNRSALASGVEARANQIRRVVEEVMEQVWCIASQS
jgi:polysaccharide pyruvyl transferase WcaK-like protein